MNKDLAELIKNNPEQAQKLISQWNEFTKANQPPLFRSQEDFSSWLTSHSNLAVDPIIWLGKEILDLYSDLLSPQSSGTENLKSKEKETAEKNKDPKILALGVLEENKKFGEISSQKGKEWLEKNNLKDFNSEEGLEYLYWSPNNLAHSNIHQETIKEFETKYPEISKIYEKADEKVYGNHNADPTYLHQQLKTWEYLKKREELFRKQWTEKKKIENQGRKLTHEEEKIQKEEYARNWQELKGKIEKTGWDHYVSRFEKKAEAYKEKSPEIKDALERKNSPKTTLFSPSGKTIFSQTAPKDRLLEAEKAGKNKLEQEAKENIVLVSPSGQTISSIPKDDKDRKDAIDKARRELEQASKEGHSAFEKARKARNVWREINKLRKPANVPQGTYGSTRVPKIPGGIGRNPVNKLNNLMRGAKNIRGAISSIGQFAKSVRTVASVARIFANPVGIAIIVVVLLTILIIVVIKPGDDELKRQQEQEQRLRAAAEQGLLPPGSYPSGLYPSGLYPSGPVPSISPPPGGGGKIVNCEFYRKSPADVNTCATYGNPGLGITGASTVKIGNPAMADLITNISTKVGVSDIVVAAVMRIELESGFTNTDPSYLINDYENTSSGVAWGIMQFTPGTFCDQFTNNQLEMSSIFGKTSCDNNGNGSSKDTSVLRIYSITDSIIAGAFYIRGLLSWCGGTINQATIDCVASRYYSSDGTCWCYDNFLSRAGCTYGPYSYGMDIWNSYSYCSSITPPTSGFVYYNQKDPQWQNQGVCPPPGACTPTTGDMACNGCGLTSLAMVLSSSGIQKTPIDVYNELNPLGLFSCSDGTYLETIVKGSSVNGTWFNSYGFDHRSLAFGPTVGELKFWLDSGWYIIGSQWIGPGLSHIFVVTAIDASGNVTLRDPNFPCCSQDSAVRPINNVLNNGYSNWIYAYAVKKVR